MKIAVLVKSVPNPAAPLELTNGYRVKRDSGEGVLDPGDEHAVEAAVAVVEKDGGDVTAISMGAQCASGAVRRALAMGAQSGVLVTDEALEGADALATARVLAATLRKGSYDLIVTGIESWDGSTGTVPITVGQLLHLPTVTFARNFDVVDNKIIAERQTSRGYKIVEAQLPCLLSVTSASNTPRYPSFKGAVRAKQSRLTVLTLADLSLSRDDVRSKQEVLKAEEIPRRTGGALITDMDAAPQMILAALEAAGVLK